MSLRHHSLVAWQRADDLFIKLHQLSLKAFPAIERFELGGQLRRAAFSVAVNIVEGFARPAGKARLNFLNISQSSLAEVGYCTA
jgi:four helix bundle protein